MKYLLDTNVLIAMFRKQHGIRERILQAGVENCFVSEATLAELKVGAYKTNDPRQWREVKETREAFSIVPITENDFDLYARNRALLENQGTKIDSNQIKTRYTMCKMPNINVGIKKLDFCEKRGMMAVYLTDGREVIVPVSMFKDISSMPVKERKKWFVLDDQYFTFENMSRVYSVTDVLDYNMSQH